MQRRNKKNYFSAFQRRLHCNTFMTATRILSSRCERNSREGVGQYNAYILYRMSLPEEISIILDYTGKQALYLRSARIKIPISNQS